MKKLELTSNELKALKVLIYADYKVYLDRYAHAASHGDTYADPYGEALGTILEKIDNA